MNESSKTVALWSDFEKSLLNGSGIDIGSGSDPVSPNARCFDIADGDANRIRDFVKDEFDYVYSSHCLEHMYNPREALHQWWALVKNGGFLIVIVPDEDLYEQGEFPSRFNPDHKWTFTISKYSSWSPVSLNLIELAQSLPESEILSIALQDNEYNRSLLKHGHYNRFEICLDFLYRSYRRVRGPSSFKRYSPVELVKHWFLKVDQTLRPMTLAQIQLVVRKKTLAA